MWCRMIFTGLLAVLTSGVCGQESRRTMHPLPRQNVTNEIAMDAPPVVFYTGAGKRAIHVASREGLRPAGG